MKTDHFLHLYMILHGNLNFSSIPKNLYSKVLDHCYWPMLDLVQQGCPMGLEFPGETLRTIQKIDPTFIKELRSLWDSKQCQVIGSTYTQMIMPLVPWDVNKKNLQLGLNTYEELLGKRPDLFFLPEQTFCKNIPNLIMEAGYKALILDWDNANEHNGYPSSYRYSTQYLKTPSGQLPILWNSSMNSFKFQRFIYGRISLQDYLSGIKAHHNASINRSLCIYGTDWEIFNFRPLTGHRTQGEEERVKLVFEALKKQKYVKLILPEEALHVSPSQKEIEISTSTVPIPTKNRDDYNVVRWAVSGRDSVVKNTLCYKTYQSLKLLQTLNPKLSFEEEWTSLVKMWGSDFRTKTTDEKQFFFFRDMGKTLGKVEDEIEKRISKITPKKDFKIINPFSIPLEKELISHSVTLPKGKFFDDIGVMIDGEKIPVQCEEVEKYQDHSLRKTRLLFPLQLKGKKKDIEGNFYSIKNPPQAPYSIKVNGPEIKIKTPQVIFESSSATGGDIQKLIFPEISDQPLIKYLPPVYFDNIAYSNDYYSGWTQVCDENGHVYNDTLPSTFRVGSTAYIHRIPISFRVPLLNGFINKTYYIYINEPRIDLSIHLYLPQQNAKFIRPAIITLYPPSFDLNSLSFQTTNGGQVIEQYPLKGRHIEHSKSPSSQCSALSCLGATQGWISVGDKDKALTIFSSKSEFYTVPLVDFEEIQDSFLFRIFHSIAESDETGHIFLQGHNYLNFSFRGQKNLDSLEEQIHNFNHPPILVQKK